VTGETIKGHPGRRRIERLRPFLSERSADALLVTSLPSIRYLSGFTGSAGVFLLTPTRAVLVTDSRYTIQANEELAGSGVGLEIAPKGLLASVAAILKRSGRKLRLAYSPSQITVAQKSTLEAELGRAIRWVDFSGVLEKLRAVKDAQELAAMREAARLISDVFAAVLPKIRIGVSELHVSAEIEYEMKTRGASGASFETIVASGPRSALPHARATPKLLSKKELVVLDQGAILRGYCSDMTRTVFLGRAPVRVRRLYEAVREAQEAAKAAVRPGITAGEIDRAARQVLESRGYGQYFTHSTGHGLGIEVHEMPRLGKGDTTTLESGMVVTIEPGAYIEGLGGVRIEDDVVVTPRAADVLTTATRDFLEL
jgi:Xaa-Pro aminopeptidase